MIVIITIKIHMIHWRTKRRRTNVIIDLTSHTYFRVTTTCSCCFHRKVEPHKLASLVIAWTCQSLVSFSRS